MFWRRRKDSQRADPDQLVHEGSLLFGQFEQHGDRRFLDLAIICFSGALGALPENSVRSRPIQSELAICLDRRGWVFGNAADVSRAVELLIQLLANAPADHGDRATYEANLALALRHRYEMSGEEADLDRALSLDEGLVKDTANGLNRALLLNNFGKDLALRFLRTSQIYDLDRSIELQREALANVPPDHFQRYGYLNNLANLLITRYRLRRASADLYEAIGNLEEALSSTSDANPDRPGLMNSLAGTLLMRAELDGNADDSGRSVRLLMDVMELASPGTPLYRGSAAGIAEAFVQRYPQTHGLDLLDNAIQITDYLISVSSDESIDPTVYWTRADAFRLRFEALASADDRQRASESARRACELSLHRSPMNTLHSARVWGKWAGTLDDWAEAAEAYAWCLRAIRILFSRQDLRRYKEEWLASATGLASDGAHGFAKAGRLHDAVATAEQCRALLLTEVLVGNEFDLKRLREHGYNDVCDRYERALAKLHRLESNPRASIGFM